MDLWVRSQNKTELVPINDMMVLRSGYLFEKGNFTYRNYEIIYKNCVLGTYKSKERALEVLDEIQNKIAYNECLKTMVPKVTTIKGYEEEYGKLFANTIYEMPKE